MATVLIIDDEPAIGDYLARLINRMGHLAQTAQTAADAFAKIDASSFNLVIADIRLPDAPDALQWIRDIAGSPISEVCMNAPPNCGLKGIRIR